MAERKATPEPRATHSVHSRVVHAVFVSVAAAIVAFSSARAEAQEPPVSLGLPAGSEDTIPAALPDVGRVPDGWTADAVGARARKSSFDVAAKDALLRAAEARVASAVVSFFPRLSGLGSYTRYQDLAQPSLGTLVEPTNPVPTGPIGPTTPLSAVPLSFTIPLNYWVFQATLTVPLSDYVLRLTQQHGAANRNAEAARSDALASEAKAYSDAKITFYQYVKAVAQRDVLVQSKGVADTHLQDAENLFRAGRASNADVLATHANVAAAQLAIDQATELVGISEEQLRLATHAPASETVSIGEDVTTALAVGVNDLPALFQEAAANRPEIRSLALGAAAQDKLASSARAGRWPSVAAFADYTYANPSPRIFLPEDEFHGYWDVGVRATWAINDVFTGTVGGAEQEAIAANLRAQLAAISARIDQRIARVRIDHATGRDVAKRQS